MKLYNFTPKFLEFIPEELEYGILYVSEEYHAMLHLCPCGCKSLVSTPFNNFGDSFYWKYERSEDLVTISPSVGNWQLPCRSHYFIVKNNIVWC